MGLRDILCGKTRESSPATNAARTAAQMYRRAAEADTDGGEELAASYRMVARAEIDRVIQPYRP